MEVGATTEFRSWQLDHVLALAVVALATMLAVWTLRRDADSLFSLLMRGILAFACLSAYPLSVAGGVATNAEWELEQWLPFHLCDALGYVAGFAILTRQPLLCELTFYYGIGATFQALVTPNLHAHAPDFFFFSFFQLHGGIVAVALALPLGMGWRPRLPVWKLLLRLLLVCNAYLVLIAFLNLALDTNFMFLRAKPEQASLYDVLGPWPWYLLSVEVLAAAVILLLTTPFMWRSRLSATRTLLRP